jgi:hypothetical protein
MSEYEKANDNELVFKPFTLKGVVIAKTKLATGCQLTFCEINQLPHVEGVFDDISENFRNGYLCFATQEFEGEVLIAINKAVSDLGSDFCQYLFFYMSSMFDETQGVSAEDAQRNINRIVTIVDNGMCKVFGKEVFKEFVDTAMRVNLNIAVNNFKLTFRVGDSGA